MSADPLSLIRLRQIQPIETEELANEFISDGVLNGSKLGEAIQLLLSYIDTEGSIMEAINRVQSRSPINFVKFEIYIMPSNQIYINNFDYRKIIGKPFNLYGGIIVFRNGVMQQQGIHFNADYERSNLYFVDDFIFDDYNNCTENISVLGVCIEQEISNELISFADENVETICRQNWGSEEGLTQREASLITITDFQNIFSGNQDIVTFEEFQYFTGLINIPAASFINCLNLSTIIIPQGVPIIRASAFNGCENLINITLPNSIYSIEQSAFQGCSNLSEIQLPKNLLRLSDKMFKNCSSLTTIHFPYSLKSIGMESFDNCNSLTEIIIPDSVIYIGSLAFNGCENLQSIKLPIGLGQLNGGIFKSCSSLSQIILPATLVYIEVEAFDGCNALTNVTCLALIPPMHNLARSLFSGCPNLSQIFVPAESVDTYKTNNSWSEYANLITAIVE